MAQVIVMTDDQARLLHTWLLAKGAPEALFSVVAQLAPVARTEINRKEGE